MPQIKEMPGRQIAAELVVADRGQTPAICAQCENERHASVGQFFRKIIVLAGSREDEPVDATFQQGFRGQAVGLRFVVCRRDDREAATRDCKPLPRNS